jgi:low-affinity ferrous iron transport protein
MERIFRALRAPGARHAIECAAPTQVAVNAGHDDKAVADEASTENVNTYTVMSKTRLLDRWLDKVVEISGSQFIFFTIVAALLTWAFLGIPFGHSNDWQVGISDAQAIVNMVFDAFLMRQQLNSHESLMFVTACLRSRISSNKRMLRGLIESGKYEMAKPTEFDKLEQTEFAAKLPSENWLGRISTAVSDFIGHIATVCAFWVCIFIWIGFGHYCGWSNTWQLYINSATSAWMVFILAFLANIRERHNNYMTSCLEYIYKADAALELRLRTVTGDRIKNGPVIIPAPKRGRLQRGIDYYADLVGTLLGIAILFFVIVIWVVIGPAMSFNSNWWLLIGTYAGLIGLNDGFVLRNVQNILSGYQDAEFTQLVYDDMDMLAVIGVPQLNEEHVADNSLTCRISIAVGNVCSHEITVVLGAILIVGLITGASAMRWSVTGQLLCNVPPSIIESFFMMILITGHNVGDAERRVDLHNLYVRRLKLISYVNTLVNSEKQ